ncbi:MAG: SusC/RagA family TonB-linked outer membrane protein [Bacteroidales bacterium]
MKRTCKLFYINTGEQKASSREPVQGRPVKINFVRKKKYLYIFLALLCNVIALSAQQKVVTGTVTSAEGELLPGVNVIEQGTQNGTVTNLDGEYSIEVSVPDATLSFSFIGYLPENISTGGKDKIDVTLIEDILQLDEIVVIGYGTQKKSDVSTAISSVSNEDLVKSSKVSFDQALQGKVSGVQIITNSGQPGGMSSVNIRGMGGLGRSEPLYVVDGVIMYDYQNNVHEGRLDYGTNVTNVLSSINPADIESIDILKDASASAIYGSRGGNGVVIITTKRGKEGKPKISFNAKYGMQTLADKMELLNAEEYIAFSNEAREASGLLPYPNWPEDPAAFGPGTDYQDEIFRAAPYQDYNLSVTGGNNGSTYYISGSYTAQDGILMNSGFQRVNLKVNNDNKLTNWLDVGTSILLGQTENQLVPHDVVRNALTRSPTLPVYTSDGLNYAGPGAFESTYTGRISNPVLIAELNNRETINKNAIGNLYAELSFLQNFKFKTSIGTDYLLAQNTLFNPTYVEMPEDTTQQPAMSNLSANAAASNVSKLNTLLENTLTYDRTFGKHAVNAVMGYTAQKFETEIMLAESNGHLTNFLTTIDAGSSVGRTAQGSKRAKTYTSVLGALRYNYDRKYYLTGNLRRDGSSVFPSDYKYGIFPSFSLAWRLSGEKFMDPLRNVISDLKIRGSWGLTGIDGNLEDNPEYALLGMRYNAVFNNEVVRGIAPAAVINPTLRWESANQTDIGIDLGLFNNKLSVIADYFYKLQKDIITESPLPRLAGMTNAYYTNVTTQAINSAEALNKGFELMVSYKQASTAFKYNISVNFSTYQNKITKLDVPLTMLSFNGGNLIRIEEGYPVSQFYGYLSDGIFTSEEELDALNATSPTGYYQVAGTRVGDVRFKDIAGRDSTGAVIPIPDGRVDDADRTFIGSPIPDFVYGASFSAEYKGFDFAMSWSGVYGNELFNGNRVYLEASTDQSNKLSVMENRWSETNPTGSLPRAVASDQNLNARNSDRFIEDGSYLKLRNIEMGYALRGEWVRKTGLSNARIFISAQNLLTITNYTGYDPDIGKDLRTDNTGLIMGFDNSFYPQSRTFMAGISLNF